MLLDHHTITEIHKHRLAECERRARYALHTRNLHPRPVQRLANSIGWLLVRLGERLTRYGFEANTTLVAGHYTKGIR